MRLNPHDPAFVTHIFSGLEFAVRELPMEELPHIHLPSPTRLVTLSLSLLLLLRWGLSLSLTLALLLFFTLVFLLVFGLVVAFFVQSAVTAVSQTR